jgi:pimeloyl-ACP methyl ester carboxylesterase
MENNGIQSLKIEVNGQHVHYLKAGNGPCVILIHGGASDSRDWLNTMSALQNRFTFYAPDLIGFGQSERRENGYYLCDFADFLLEFIDILKLEKPALAGHSLGGRICLDVALARPETIGKLVLIDASGLGNVTWYGTIMYSFFHLLREAMRKWQPYPRFLAKKGKRFDAPYKEELRNLTAPTLLVWNRTDPYLPLSIAKRAMKLMPNAQLAVVDGYGHAPHRENSEAFNKIFLEFLDGGHTTGQR